MTREDKAQVIDSLAEAIANNRYFYITDHSALTVEKTNELRRRCFESEVQLKVVKNSLIRKAMEKASEQTGNTYSELYDVLKGFSALMFAERGNAPARLIEKFREDGNEKPILKGAFIDSGIFIGDDQLESLTKIKSKEELIGDVILLLQSPIKNLVGALQSGGSTIAGLLKTLEEREG